MSVVMIQSNPDTGLGRDLPAWMRRAGIDEATGTVFLPPGLANRGEREAYLCASWDGDVPCVIDDGHVYLGRFAPGHQILRRPPRFRSRR